MQPRRPLPERWLKIHKKHIRRLLTGDYSFLVEWLHFIKAQPLSLEELKDLRLEIAKENKTSDSKETEKPPYDILFEGLLELYGIAREENFSKAQAYFQEVANSSKDDVVLSNAQILEGLVHDSRAHQHTDKNRQQEECKEANQKYAEAIHKNQKNALARVLQGMAQTDEKKKIEEYTIAASLGSPEAMCRKAFRIQKSKRLEAIALHDQAIALQYPRSMFLRAQIYEDEKNLEHAAFWYRRAYEEGGRESSWEFPARFTPLYTANLNNPSVQYHYGMAMQDRDILIALLDKSPREFTGLLKKEILEIGTNPEGKKIRKENARLLRDPFFIQFMKEQGSQLSLELFDEEENMALGFMYFHEYLKDRNNKGLRQRAMLHFSGAKDQGLTEEKFKTAYQLIAGTFEEKEIKGFDEEEKNTNYNQLEKDIFHSFRNELVEESKKLEDKEKLQETKYKEMKSELERNILEQSKKLEEREKKLEDKEKLQETEYKEMKSEFERNILEQSKELKEREKKLKAMEAKLEIDVVVSSLRSELFKSKLILSGVGLGATGGGSAGIASLLFSLSPFGLLGIAVGSTAFALLLYIIIARNSSSGLSHAPGP